MKNSINKTERVASIQISVGVMVRILPKRKAERSGVKPGARKLKMIPTAIQPQPDTAEGGMSDAAADEHQTACHNVGTYDAAGDAGKQTSQQGMPEESIM